MKTMPRTKAQKAKARAERVRVIEELEKTARFWRHAKQSYQLVGYGTPVNSQSQRVTAPRKGRR